MSWVTEDGLHEGYAAHIAKDGREAVGTMRDGMVMEHGRLLPGGEWESGEILPWSELLGWEAHCDCNSPTSGRLDRTLVGPMWRAATTTPRNPGDVAQDPEEAFVGDGSATVEDCIRAWWLAHLEERNS